MSGAQAEIFMSCAPSRGPCGDGSGSMERLQQTCRWKKPTTLWIFFLSFFLSFFLFLPSFFFFHLLEVRLKEEWLEAVCEVPTLATSEPVRLGLSLKELGDWCIWWKRQYAEFYSRHG